MKLKSNEPFWLIKNGIIQDYPSLRNDTSCEVLIIGGGITGGLIAHQCVEDGFDTIVIDKREIANGSSCASTSMLQYEIDIPLVKLIEMIGKQGALASYNSCWKAIDKIEEICMQIDSKSGFMKKDSLYCAASARHKNFLFKEFETRQKNGFDVFWLEGEEISQKFGLVNTHGGILSKQGASVDAFRLVHDLLEFNVKRGLRVFDKTEMIDVKYGERSTEVLVDTGAKITAKKIIYCVGYESAYLIPEKIVKLISTYAIVSEANCEINKYLDKLLVWNTSVPYNYFRTTDDGRFLIGGEDEEFYNPPKRDALIGEKEQKLLKTFKELLPQVPFYLDFSWAGTFGQTKDALPYIGTHKLFLDSYFVLGFGGNGITFSAVGMEMVSQWLKGKTHRLDKWFKFER